MKLGEKIKQIRKDKGWSQDYICTQSKINQSTLSGIEHNKWNAPETTVRDLANALEISFEALIEGTDWQSDDKKNLIRLYAISPSEVKVTIDDNGGWYYHHLSYPIKDSDGGENKFSPFTGKALIYQCKNCKRGVNKPEHKYCMGCGQNLIPDFDVFDEIKEMMTHIPFMIDPHAAEECLQRLTDLSSYYNDLIRRVKSLETMLKIISDKKKEASLKKAVGKDYQSTFEKNMGKIIKELTSLNIDVGEWNKNNTPIVFFEDIRNQIDFNIKISEGLAKNMYVHIQKNPQASNFETIRLELYRRLAETIDDVSNSLAIDFAKDPALEKLSGINEETRANRVKEKLETLNQLKEMFQNLDDVKDESYKDIENLINKASTLTDEKISTDSDEDKTESTENNDSSSKVEEKSNNDKTGVS